MQITVTINAPELVSALSALAGSISGKNIPMPTPTQAAPMQQPIQQPVQQPMQQPIQLPAQQPVQTQQPIQQPVQQPVQQPGFDPVTGAAPTMPVTPPAGTVPTTVQTYTMEQIAVAATQLVDAGRRNELVSLLGQFGVQALTALPKEQYGNFATALRQMGARI
ncbi:MAG: hypothetical protein ACOY4I_04635 [Bacillota bacterium]